MVRHLPRLDRHQMLCASSLMIRLFLQFAIMMVCAKSCNNTRRIYIEVSRRIILQCRISRIKNIVLGAHQLLESDISQILCWSLRRAYYKMHGVLSYLSFSADIFPRALSLCCRCVRVNLIPQLLLMHTVYLSIGTMSKSYLLT